MDERLLEAALSGNETTLNALIQEDPLILHRISLSSFHETPLHIASLNGNLDFVTAILSRKPEYLTKADSFGRCPLHLASAEGHVEIVKKLFQGCPEVALKRDQDGRMPLELAALNEQCGVLTFLLQENSLLAKKADSDSTILHLCIRHNSIEALKLLVNCWSRDELVNLKDENGNNLLHLAAIHKQIETVKYLLGEVGVGEKWNSRNRNGFTAIDVLGHIPRDWTTLEIHAILMKSGIQRAEVLKRSTQTPSQETCSSVTKKLLSSLHLRNVGKFVKEKVWHQILKNEDEDWADQIRGNILVAATVIATVSFKGGPNPPGGLWQDSNSGHKAGTSIIASRDFEAYFNFISCNIIAMMWSSGIILLMVSGFPLYSKVVMVLLKVAMTLTIGMMLSTYNITTRSVLITAKNIPDLYPRIVSFFNVTSASCKGIFLLALLFYLARFLVWFVSKMLIILKAGSGLIKRVLELEFARV